MAMAEGLGESTTRDLWGLLTEKLLTNEVKNTMVEEVRAGLVGATACTRRTDHVLSHLSTDISFSRS